jgi:hypothetical protein
MLIVAIKAVVLFVIILSCHCTDCCGTFIILFPLSLMLLTNMYFLVKHFQPCLKNRTGAYPRIGRVTRMLQL